MVDLLYITILYIHFRDPRRPLTISTDTLAFGTVHTLIKVKVPRRKTGRDKIFTFSKRYFFSLPTKLLYFTVDSGEWRNWQVFYQSSGRVYI